MNISASAPVVSSDVTVPATTDTPREKVCLSADTRLAIITGIFRLFKEYCTTNRCRLVFKWTKEGRFDKFDLIDEPQKSESTGYAQSWPRPKDDPIVFGYSKLEDWV